MQRGPTYFPEQGFRFGAVPVFVVPGEGELRALRSCDMSPVDSSAVRRVASADWRILRTVAARVE